MRHTLSVLVENHPGVLMRVAALFSRRSYNIESLAVGVTQNPTLSRITAVAQGDDAVIEQVTKQLYKLINTVQVMDITNVDSVCRELALIKVRAESLDRAAIVQIADIFRAKVVDMGRNSMIIELTGDEDKIDATLTLLADFGVIEVVRTGQIAMTRGAGALDGANDTQRGDDADGESSLRSGCRHEYASGQERSGSWIW